MTKSCLWLFLYTNLLFIIQNDAATLVISVDNTEISERPDKWRIGQLLTMSMVLAIMLTALSFAHFYIARDYFLVDNYVLHSIMYLHISSAPHFVIFSTRVPGYWYKNMPHWIFTVCILATQVIALFFAVYGVFGEKEEVAPCGWAWGMSVLGISLVYFMIMDVVKVWMFKRWNFELTAKLSPTPKRKAKLAKRKQEAIVSQRLEQTWKKVQDPVEAHQIVAAFRNLSSAQH